MIKKLIESKGKKEQILPFIEIHAPDVPPFTFIINKDRAIVGRHSGKNDIVLEPILQKLVTRNMHCMIESRENGYWLFDNASKNGTFLKRSGQDKTHIGRRKAI